MVVRNGPEFSCDFQVRDAPNTIRWSAILPFAERFLSACLDRGKCAALVKKRVCHEQLRLVYEAEMAAYRLILEAAHAGIAHFWRGRQERLRYLAKRVALEDIQRAWRKACGRRALQREIDARVAVRRCL